MSAHHALRINEFSEAGRSIIYFDLSAIKSNKLLAEVLEASRQTITKYREAQVYAITNISNIAYDTETKEMLAEWMKFNEPFIVQSVFIGTDGLKRIMLGSVLKLSGRRNVRTAETKEQAIALLMSE